MFQPVAGAFDPESKQVPNIFCEIFALHFPSFGLGFGEIAAASCCGFSRSSLTEPSDLAEDEKALPVDVLQAISM